MCGIAEADLKAAEEALARAREHHRGLYTETSDVRYNQMPASQCEPHDVPRAIAPQAWYTSVMRACKHAPSRTAGSHLCGHVELMPSLLMGYTLIFMIMSHQRLTARASHVRGVRSCTAPGLGSSSNQSSCLGWVQDQAGRHHGHLRQGGPPGPAGSGERPRLGVSPCFLAMPLSVLSRSDKAWGWGFPHPEAALQAITAIAAHVCMLA